MSGTTANLGITSIGQISIIVHDLQSATAFYRDALGLPLLFTAGNLAFFDCGGVRLMLGPRKRQSSIIRAPSSTSGLRISTPRTSFFSRGVCRLWRRRV